MCIKRTAEPNRQKWKIKFFSHLLPLISLASTAHFFLQLSDFNPFTPSQTISPFSCNEMLTFLLILLYGCPVFNSESDQEIDGNATSTTCWPKLNRISFWSGIIGIGYEHGDDCPQDAFLVPTFPDDLDMKNMMGR